MTVRSPNDLIAAFSYQLPADTAGNVVFICGTPPTFVVLCEGDIPLGKDKRGFLWIRGQADQFKFRVDPVARSFDFAALCGRAKSQVPRWSPMLAIRNTNGVNVSYSEHLMKKLLNPDELIAALPYKFASRHIGLTSHRGWQNLFSRLCFDIEAALWLDKRGFHWVRIKDTYFCDYHARHFPKHKESLPPNWWNMNGGGSKWWA